MKEFCSQSNTPHSNGSAGGSLPDLIELSSSVGTIELLGPVPLPISSQDITPRWYVARVQSDTAKQEVELSLLVFGNPEKSEHAPLVRIHSTCFTGDVLGSLRCDCGPQLDATIDKMSVDPSGGILVYMAQHEGRGIGLWAKAQAYALQDQGLDTYEANRSLGFQDDHRDYQTAVTVLTAFLGDRPFRLLTNNPDKVVSLSGGNLGTCVREELVAGWGKRNQRYLDAKRRHGHMIGE